ncbi:MAG: hypothetical protein J0H23_11490 [Micrococcales bacterium]|nr:hypothetical protein [Micrococcales bacterium]
MFPDVSAIGDTAALVAVLGALMTVALVIAVLMIVICAAVWAVANSGGNWQAASRAKTGLFIALGAAILTGAVVVWANFLVDLGESI